MTRVELQETLTHGPAHEALCLRCQNQTTDERCEGCIFGHFRGAEDFKLPCRKCHCQVNIKQREKIVKIFIFMHEYPCFVFSGPRR